MNGIFLAIFLLCGGYFLIFNPASFLSVLLGGGQKAATLCLSLLAVYAVWSGFLNVLTKSGLGQKISKLLHPLLKKIFFIEDKEALECVCMNLSANLLGVSGAATPFGIKAAERLQGLPHARYNHTALFILNCAGVQFLPTTALALLAAHGAQNSAFIILPCFLATLVNATVGVILLKIFVKKDK
ncbi:MAG: spore maturation protein [Clostridia bacterium]|nr:spore maturation protein [Clostridia bacterium]